MNTSGLLLPLLLMTLFSNNISLYGQGSDMIVLKRGSEKTIKTYLAGTQINFISSSGSNVQGRIKKIDKDTLFINIYDEGAVYNRWGTTFWDTLSVTLLKYHIKDVSEIVKPREGLGFIKNGLLFMIGGTSYAILHVVNSAYLKQPIAPATLAISGGIALTGYVLNRVHKNTVRLGGRYYLQYIPMK